MVTNTLDDSNENELYVDRDIMVLANPEIAGLPDWVIALVAAGGLAAALSTAAGLLMVISSAVSHDLFKRMLVPEISEKGELRLARIAAAVAVVFAGLLGIFPPDYVAAVVAFAFGLAASSFFPAILMGIFWKRMNAPGGRRGHGGGHHGHHGVHRLLQVHQPGGERLRELVPGDLPGRLRDDRHASELRGLDPRRSGHASTRTGGSGVGGFDPGPVGSRRGEGTVGLIQRESGRV